MKNAKSCLNFLAARGRRSSLLLPSAATASCIQQARNVSTADDFLKRAFPKLDLKTHEDYYRFSIEKVSAERD